MRALVALAALLLALPCAAAPKKAPGPPPPLALAHLALPRVDVLLRGDVALVTADLTFTRGAYQGGAIDAFVAYGGPGLPRAFDAQLLPVEAAFLAPPPAATGSPVAAAHATLAPPEASLALGPRHGAGQRLTLPPEALQAALAPSGLAALRLRWVYGFPTARTPHRAVLVRATESGRTLPLGALRLRAAEGSLASATAALCGPGSPAPLALVGQPGLLPLRSPARLPAGAAGDLCFDASLAP